MYHFPLANNNSSCNYSIYLRGQINELMIILFCCKKCIYLCSQFKVRWSLAHLKKKIFPLYPLGIMV